MPGLRIGIDTGGTFTDVAVLEGLRLRIHKVPSTPSDPADAVLAGLADVRGTRTVDVVHGSTVGLNAVLTGTLARTALVTNAGFQDLCEIGRQDRLDLYALEPSRTKFPVPRALRFEIDVRRDGSGRVIQPLDPAAVDALAAKLRRARVEAVAICLLHSYRNARDERAIARRLRAALGVPVTCSADLLPRHGEFERLAAATVNAAIQPVMGAYLRRLGSGVRPGTLRLMRSSGGAMSAKEAVEYPARAAFSGPAGGIVASGLFASRLGVDRVAAFDMGGTSTDVALVGTDPAPSETDRTLGGLPLALPSFDVHTVGCGGGSIAYVDGGGALRVGPESAGADPGPACYGKGEEPTVTDAHVVLGHIGEATLLGGSMHLDVDRSVRAIERLAARLGTDVARCAEGILEVAEIAMMRALLVITSQRAVDPARVPLLAYGGAGGLHAAGLAGRLRMPFAAVPAAP
ncbi:MAG: hydantoinase/oxoprolinase family protein, partial [Planctomycetota bacterium]|nr:hydantoinase/oxoprolinase family protein [Planctomycetota bacterium]